MRCQLLFHVWPYAALALLALGMIVRYALIRHRTQTDQAELSEAWATYGGGKVWRFSLFMLFVAHLVGLLAPHAVILASRAPAWLYACEAAGFSVGLLALGGWAALMWRHLGRSRVSIFAEVGDAIFLSLVFLSIASGLLMAVVYRWASSWGAAILTPYFVSLVQGTPATELVDQLPCLVRLHVVSSFGVAAAIPITRLAPALFALLHRAIEVAGRPVGVVSRAASEWLRAHNPALWIWPVEDAEPAFALSEEWVPRTISGFQKSAVRRVFPRYEEELDGDPASGQAVGYETGSKTQ